METKHAILIAGVSAILADVLPTPADYAYFKIEKSLRDKFKNSEITAKQYWTREMLAYYTLNPIWCALLMGITLSVKGDLKTKIAVGAGLVSIGAIVGLMSSDIRKETIREQNKEQIK